MYSPVMTNKVAPNTIAVYHLVSSLCNSFLKSQVTALYTKANFIPALNVNIVMTYSV